jgi:CHC2-type zinc finger protein
MSGRHFDSTENAELRAKIDEAKRRLPLPDLMAKEGFGDRAKKSAHCPLHDDEHKSFSVFEGIDGFWHWKCFAECGDGDEIMFLRKLKNLSLTDAMNLYLEEAGFRACAPRKSREYPKSPEALRICVSESPCVSVSPMSEGQGLDKEPEKELTALAARNACTHAEDKAERKRFKLARDVSGVEKKIGRKLTMAELKRTCDEWERASVPFLGFGDDDHFTMFLAELTKVRVPTGEGDTFNKALENVAKLPDSDLPEIPGYADAPKPVRKLAALHREMSRLCGGNIYFLSYRDAAKACKELSHQSAHTITLALARIGVIEIVSKGKAGLNSRRAAEFRYLLPEAESAEEDDDEIPV